MRQLFVPGDPVTQGSKKPIPGRMVEVAGDRLKVWRARIGWTATAAGWKHETIGAGPVRADLRFVLPRVVSDPGRYWACGHNTGDLDKLIRAVGDALSKIAYRDDCQIVAITATKHHGDIPGVHISIEPIEEGTR